MTCKRWTSEEICFLKARWETKTDKELSRTLTGRTVQAIKDKRVKLGLRKQFSWTKYEKGFLERHWSTQTDEQLAASLPNRTVRATKAKRLSLGLLRTGEKWSPYHDCCQECSATDIPHCAHGLCQKCYQSQYAQTQKYKAYRRRYCQTHQEERRKRHKEWYKRNKAKARASKREWLAQHPRYNSKQGKKWRREHPNYNWAAQSPEKNRAKSRRHYARKKGVETEIFDEDEIYELFGGACIYCGSKDDLTLDHIVPLSMGGAHKEDNLVVACRRCNASKGARPLEEWLETQPRARAWVE